MRTKQFTRAGMLAPHRLLFASTLAAAALVSSGASAGGGVQPGCVPSPEVCDGIDNDCDGVIDNGNPGGTVPCITGLLGACGPGTLTCVSGALECVPELLPGWAPEVCDGIDNDCDGLVDEGFSVGVPCEVGAGACTRDGWLVCNSAGTGTLCNAIPGAPEDEICDGIDNDCNGFVDDGNPNGGDACDTGMPGACAPGGTFCSNGTLICLASLIPGGAVEVCDGVDNDCDGAVDEDDPGGGIPCDSGLLGVCKRGTTRCLGGAITCQPNILPGTHHELCGDLADSDCDGDPDNGCGGAGGAGGQSGAGSAGAGGGSAGCVDDSDCAGSATCAVDEDGVGTCVPANPDDRPYGAWAGCACTTEPGRQAPLDLLWGAMLAASALVASSRARRRR